MGKTKKVTIREVASACNVSVPSVSRVLNNNFDGFSLKQNKIDLIRKTCEEMGYKPNRFAQSLRRQRSGFIGMSLSYDPTWDQKNGQIQNPLISGIGKLVGGACSILDQHHYNLIFLPRHETQDKPFEDEEIFPHLVDGVIYINPTQEHQEYMDIARSRKYITVVGGTGLEDHVPSVDIDNEKEMEKLTAHMIENGCKKILLLSFTGENYHIVRKRQAGYIKAMKNHGLAVNEKLIYHQEMNREDVPQLVRKILKRHRSTDGILVSVGSFFLSEIMKGIEAAERSVPDNLKIAVFHGEPEMTILWPDITHIEVSQYHIAAAAADYLIKGIEKKNMGKENIYIPCDLIVGASTGGTASQKKYVPTYL